MSRLLLFLCVSVTSACVDGARILGVFHATSPSHYFSGNKLLKELAFRGHEVTMISSFGMKTPMKNYRDIVLTGFNEKVDEMHNMMVTLSGTSIFTQMLFMLKFNPKLAGDTLNHTSVQKLLQSDEKFDLIIIESFMNEIHLGLAHHFDAPIIILSTVAANPLLNQLSVNPDPSSYVSMVFNYTGKMNFLQRLFNGLIGILSDAFFNLYYMKQQNELMHVYFPDAPHITELYKKVAMVLLNSHVSFNAAKPLVPNMVEIGGFHIDQVKELPKDLKEYLDSCKEGFILFSLGSNLKSSNLTPEVRQAIIKVLTKLPYQVLWKFEEDNLPGKPVNVRIEKWLPQNDILAHENIKLFITHGGLFSTIETVYHGVPIVGIPMIGDQNMNMIRAEQIGIGKYLDFNTLEEKKMFEVINEVIDNPSYRDNVRRRSALMRDQPLRPIDTAVFWTEHVLRHGGAEHFQTGALELRWYELYQLDVIGLVLTVAFLALYIPCKIFKCIFCGKKASKDRSKKTN